MYICVCVKNDDARIMPFPSCITMVIRWRSDSRTPPCPRFDLSALVARARPDWVNGGVAVTGRSNGRWHGAVRNAKPGRKDWRLEDHHMNRKQCQYGMFMSNHWTSTSSIIITCDNIYVCKLNHANIITIYILINGTAALRKSWLTSTCVKSLIVSPRLEPREWHSDTKMIRHSSLAIYYSKVGI